MSVTEQTDVSFVEAAMKRLGATTTETAVTREELPNFIRDYLAAHVRSGVLVESSPGHFFLNSRTRAHQRSRLLLGVVFWSLAVLLPLVFIYVLR